MKFKHTPGPWRAGSGTGGKGSVVSDQLAVGALGGSDAVDYYGGNLIAESVAQENIPLIAAAPQLLVVARDFDEALTESGLHCECGEADCRTTRLRAAIAKATGSAA